MADFEANAERMERLVVELRERLVAVKVFNLDLPIVEWGRENEIAVIRGPEDDVLARFARAAISSTTACAEPRPPRESYEPTSIAMVDPRGSIDSLLSRINSLLRELNALLWSN